MDRIIYKTQTLVVGSGSAAIEAAGAAMVAKAQTMMLDASPIANAPTDVTTVEPTVLDKIILYPEGRVAGVMGHRVSDGRKVIVNCDSVILTAEAALCYEDLCLRFDAQKTDNGLLHTETGLLLNSKGKEIGGVFVMTEPGVTGSAGGAYSVFVDETIYARFREHPMVNEAPKIEGDYFLTIIGMPDVPKHHIVIENKDGVLSGTHETENDVQVMQDVRIEDGYLCWNLWSGTTSSELFTFQVKPYGNCFLGGTCRIDTENAHRTPVMMESSRPMHPFGPPQEQEGA